ncbi:MAG: SDR family NAD(P)-dependent oxidoreductase, partial [Chloroflexota bacterium]
TDSVSISAVHATVAAQVTHLNLLINNAAIFSTTPFRDLTPEESLRMFAVNSVAPVIVTRAFFDMLAEEAVICNISSNRGSVSGQIKGGLMDYAASKAALNSYTRSIAAEAAQHGMKAVMIDPGWVQTRMGGDNAALTPDETVAGMINVIENLTPEQNGAFLTHDGTPQLW